MSVPAIHWRTVAAIIIDVEGGQATLVVTPAGQTLLIDVWYGARGGRDPDRIMAAARDARIDRIDYLLITSLAAPRVEE